LFPEGDFDHDAGVALTTVGGDRLLGDVHHSAALHQVVFDWADGVDARMADRELDRAGFQVLTNEGALKPASVTNLGEVEALPRFLAMFLAVLGLATLGHALFTSLRRRSQELGTLRALGMMPAEGSAIVAVQALTIAAVAIAVGVPLGLLLGARVWTSIATDAHVVVRSVVPATQIAVVVAAALVAVGAVAALPAWRALRSRASDILRAE
jgi:predicted lysophospholipase L1 biosynthesis ABC-type transport system permease subunit